MEGALPIVGGVLGGAELAHQSMKIPAINSRFFNPDGTYKNTFDQSVAEDLKDTPLSFLEPYIPPPKPTGEGADSPIRLGSPMSQAFLGGSGRTGPTNVSEYFSSSRRPSGDRAARHAGGRGRIWPREHRGPAGDSRGGLGHSDGVECEHRRRLVVVGARGAGSPHASSSGGGWATSPGSSLAAASGAKPSVGSMLLGGPHDVGGILPGDSPGHDNMWPASSGGAVSLEGGEFVVNPTQTQANLSLLQAINSGTLPHFDQGGGPVPPQAPPGQQSPGGRFSSSRWAAARG